MGFQKDKKNKENYIKAKRKRGLFDSRTPLLLTMYNKKKKAQPLAKLSFLVTRTGIEPMLQP